MRSTDFLAGLPALLGVGGYVALLIHRMAGRAPQVVLRIIDIIKDKGASLPELDDRLTAKGVKELLDKHPELRRRLEEADYAILEHAMRSESRTNAFALGGMLVALLISVLAFGAMEVARTRVTSASLSALPPTGVSAAHPNTFDDLVVTWQNSGNDGAIAVSIVLADDPSVRVTKSAMTSDHQKAFGAEVLKPLWRHPQPGQRFPVRVEFGGTESSANFGPFEVEAAIQLLYFLEGHRLTVATMDGNGRLVQQAFKAKCVAESNVPKRTDDMVQSVTVEASNGKAYADYPVDFSADPQNVRCVYLGDYPAEYVRYTNMLKE